MVYKTDYIPITKKRKKRYFLQVSRNRVAKKRCWIGVLKLCKDWGMANVSLPTRITCTRRVKTPRKFEALHEVVLEYAKQFLIRNMPHTFVP